jgi:dihydroflavonol-4-reductase
VVLTSSVAAIGPVRAGEVGSEDDLYRGGGLGLTYADAKHEGEAEALAAAARMDVELVIVNPCYVLGVPVDRSYPGETSARTVANYMRGRLPAVVDGETDIVDVEDVAAGHLLAAEKGKPGERYVLGGHAIDWVDLIDRIAHISGVRRPLVVIPREVAGLAKLQSELGLPGPISPQAYVLMAQNWSYSSAKARRELGYRARPLIQTLEATIEWCRELIAHDAFEGRPTSLSLAAQGLALGDRLGLISVLRAAESRVGRRLVAGA